MAKTDKELTIEFACALLANPKFLDEIKKVDVEKIIKNSYDIISNLGK